MKKICLWIWLSKPLPQPSHLKYNNYSRSCVKIAHISWSDPQNEGHFYTLHYPLKLILESFPGLKPGLPTKIIRTGNTGPCYSCHFNQSATKTWLKFSYVTLTAKTSRGNEVAPHFTVQLKHSVRNTAAVCYTGKAVSISVRCGVNHLDFPKRPYGFVYDVLAACALHP